MRGRGKRRAASRLGSPRPSTGRDFNPKARHAAGASKGDSQAPAPRRPIGLAAARAIGFALALSIALGPPAFGQRRFGPLERTVESWIDAPAGWRALKVDRAERFTSDLMRAVEAYPESESGWHLALSAATLDRRSLGGQGVRLVARTGNETIRDLLTSPATAPAVRTWALTEVLVGPDPGSSSRRSKRRESEFDVTERVVALEHLTDLRVPGVRTALLTIARRPEDPMRREAYRALANWAGRFGPDDAIDLFLVQQLGAGLDREVEPHPMTVVLERLGASDDPLSPRAQALLRERIDVMLLSRDWREPVRAVRLVKGLEMEDRISILLDTLSVWDRRARTDQDIPGMVRVRNDIARELRDISGLHHGVEPKPWIDWWVRVRQGALPMPGTAQFEEAERKRLDEPRSSASFFGLRPATDRVTFVIDISGSMSSGWGTTERSRYDEAVEQLMRFLHGAAPTTHFNVILFSTDPVLSSPELVPATPDRLQRARNALLGRKPNGGTNLRPAIELALKLDAFGKPDLDELEADTVIVLCDGGTSEGPRWVEPTLERVLPLYPVIFHTVHLGSSDDGTLRALAELSGGTFLRVGG